MKWVMDGEKNAWSAETKINSGETQCFRVQDIAQ